jgi:hypothetical protein
MATKLLMLAAATVLGPEPADGCAMIAASDSMIKVLLSVSTMHRCCEVHCLDPMQLTVNSVRSPWASLSHVLSVVPAASPGHANSSV